jgi:hypothetical protein
MCHITSGEFDARSNSGDRAKSLILWRATAFVRAMPYTLVSLLNAALFNHAR